MWGCAVFGKRQEFEATAVRIDGTVWEEFDCKVERDMLLLFDHTGAQVETWPKTDNVAVYSSRGGMVYLLRGDLPALTIAADMASLEERIPFYALNQPTRDSTKSYATMLSAASVVILVVMMIWVNQAASSASSAAAGVTNLTNVIRVLSTPAPSVRP
jgi:hypothetical protein